MQQDPPTPPQLWIHHTSRTPHTTVLHITDAPCPLLLISTHAPEAQTAETIQLCLTPEQREALPGTPPPPHIIRALAALLRLHTAALAA